MKPDFMDRIKMKLSDNIDTASHVWYNKDMGNGAHIDQ